VSLNVTRVVAALAATATLAAVPAYAAPADFVDPNTEGSVTDSENMKQGALSDTTGIQVNVHPNGCVASVERPQTQASTASPTGLVLKSQLFVTCALLATATDTVRIERARWSGWEGLGSPVSMTAYPQGVATQSAVTPCKAGSWTYRTAVTGTHSFHSPSARFTCVQQTDLFFIDG